VLAAHPESGAERGRIAAEHGVGVGEDHLADHAVGVELLVAARRVPAAGEPFLVLGEPLLLELLVAHDLELLAQRFALGEVGVERVVELRVEIGAVLLVRQSRMTVRRDDHVVVGHAASSYFFGTFHGDGATRYSGSLAFAIAAARASIVARDRSLGR
jgi:hypothetical protein